MWWVKAGHMGNTGRQVPAEGMHGNTKGMGKKNKVRPRHHCTHKVEGWAQINTAGTIPQCVTRQGNCPGKGSKGTGMGTKKAQGK